MGSSTIMGSSNIIRLPEPGEYVIASFSQEHRLGYGAMKLQPMVQASGYLHVVRDHSRTVPNPHLEFLQVKPTSWSV
jgi:hypothetical protein